MGSILLLLATTAMGEVKYMTTEDFKQKVFNYQTERDWCYQDTVPCIIDFYTTWCGPCKRLAPIMEELSETYRGRVLFYKVDTEQERELAAAWGINSIPQVLYVPTSGRPMMLKGLYPKDEIVKVITEFLKVY